MVRNNILYNFAIKRSHLRFYILIISPYIRNHMTNIYLYQMGSFCGHSQSQRDECNVVSHWLNAEQNDHCFFWGVKLQVLPSIVLGSKPLSKPILSNCQLLRDITNFSTIWIKIGKRICHPGKCFENILCKMTFCLCIDELPNLSPGKMAAISQTIFSDAFSWMKSFVFWLKFHWGLSLRSNWQ